MNIRILCLLTTGVLLGLAGSTHAMAPRPTPPPVPMEFVRAAYEPDAGAIAIEWVIPRMNAVGPLDRLEMMMINAKGNAVFGALQNLGDRCDPVPPGAFGVVLDPTSDNRSIKNVASAGQNGQWDQEAPGGILLKQSVSGVAGGNLGIAFWIVPKDWNPDRYLIAVRAIRKNSRPEPWRNLATFDFSGDGVTAVVTSRCRVKPVFVQVSGEEPMPLDHVNSAILIRYERQPQNKGVEIKRWPGDTSGQHKYVEKETRKLKLSDFPDGVISLEPGFYRFRHNSVSGQPPSGFHGESPVFEIKPGQEAIEVRVPLNPAI